MFINLPITRHNIKNAPTSDPRRCLLARALGRVVLPKIGVSVGVEDISFEPEGEPEVEVRHTKQTSQLVDDFDDKKKVKPCVVRVNVPKKFLRPEFGGYATPKKGK